jgi:ATP-binding cassette subfamily B protein
MKPEILMKPEISLSAPPLPTHWASALEAPQSPVKNTNSILAWVELDLDGEMRFEKSLLCLIRSGLFWSDGTESEFWSISSGAHLLHGDHAGVGHLKLESETSLLRLWYFTLAVNPQVLRLQSSFKRLIQGDQTAKEPEASEYDKQVCPVCLSPKPANSDACPTCDPEDDAPPSTKKSFYWAFS